VNIFLLCSPDCYAVKYKINPWMDTSNDSDHFKANEQWLNLCDVVRKYADDVKIIGQIEGLPDMVFTANAGLPLPDKNFVISRFRYYQRAGEEKHFREYFEKHDWRIHETTFPFEGAGDALFLQEKMICGFGFRTEQGAYEEIERMTGFVPNFVRLVDSRFYHLDTCFCPLQDGDFLFFPPAFDDESQKKLRDLGRAVEVSAEEAENFACNAVVIDRTVILPTGCPKTMDLLQSLDYEPFAVEMTEFIKSGGACRCLILQI